MNPITVALVYLAASAAVLPLGFKVFKTNFAWIDIAMASVGAALASLIPTIGGPASLLVMIAILYWRIPRHHSVRRRRTPEHAPRALSPR